MADWMQVHSGKPVDLPELKPEQVDVRDIAHSLACTCRFMGHVKGAPYSVAQHSVLVSLEVQKIMHKIKEDGMCTREGWNEMMDVEWRAALMHDAMEAYMGDMTRPWKYGTEMGILFKFHENRIADVISRALSLPTLTSPAIKLCDNRLLATEQRDVMNPCERKWSQTHLVEPLPDQIVPWPWDYAEQRFLERWQECGGTL